MIDIVDELQAEASYRYSDLFGRAADEIKMLRRALNNIAAVTFCPKCHGKKELNMPSPNEDPSGQRREPMSPHPLDAGDPTTTRKRGGLRTEAGNG